MSLGSIHLADDGLAHAFCVCPDQSQRVARKVVEFMHAAGVVERGPRSDPNEEEIEFVSHENAPLRP